MARQRHYTLTETAAEDFRAARAWSLVRWGKALTKQYFHDLHEGAEFVALNHRSLHDRNDLTGDTGLGIHAVREHFLVYVPMAENSIVVVALIRQVRDVPAILKKSAFRIRRELRDILGRG